MTEVTAGKIKMNVRQPYPAWVDIYHDGKKIATIHHSELSDLAYVVKKSSQLARGYLGGRAEEVVLL